MITEQMVEAACKAYYDSADEAIYVDHAWMRAALEAALSQGEAVTYTSETQLKAVRECGDGIMMQESGDPRWNIALYRHPQPAPQSQAVGRTLYVDLDGVMADFDAAFPAVFGLDHRSLADEEMWGHINSHASFFRDLPPMPGAIEFFRSVEHLQPVILTACPKSNYAHVAAQKRAWVRAHLSQTCLVLPVMGGRHKPLFMHQAGDVLIDDFGKNCAAWNEAGGIAIKHEGDWSATRAALDMIGNDGARSG